MRAFLISYTWSSGKTSGSGNVYISGDSFPSNAYIRRELMKDPQINNPVIMNIFEFKSMKDYNDFMSEESDT
jgi:hypothetical protein